MKVFLFLIGSLLLVSCAALPAITAPPGGSGGKAFACPSPYPAGKNRFIHAIEVHRAGQAQTVLVGVTLIDPALRTISCALVSAEGMALFEAASGPAGLTVSRALPPFDAKDFARNMMADIELIFLAPRDAPVQKGVLAGGEAVCRHQGRGWTDVAAAPGGSVHIRHYSGAGGLKRSITLAGGGRPYATIELHAADLFEYTLVMTLIESETIQDKPTQRQ
ncbi:MAG: hypothetical protein K4571_16865 [Deltaproteobacteria bacterium]